MYSLTQEEYDQLELQTSHVPGQEDEYIITLEVFHQLHCLVSSSINHYVADIVLTCKELSSTTRLRHRSI